MLFTGIQLCTQLPVQQGSVEIPRPNRRHFPWNMTSQILLATTQIASLPPPEAADRGHVSAPSLLLSLCWSNQAHRRAELKQLRFSLNWSMGPEQPSAEGLTDIFGATGGQAPSAEIIRYCTWKIPFGVGLQVPRVINAAPSPQQQALHFSKHPFLSNPAQISVFCSIH